ncbi:MAG: zinc-binding protein, partial [Nitrospira sp.]|nr:zinc-binding protein [Nitrospira sp.]
GINRKNLIVIDTSKDIQLAEGYMNHDSKHGFDPHVWLDLSNAQKMVDTIRDGFITKDPAHKDHYSQNAGGYKTRLYELDKRFSDSFVTCKKDVFIHGGHFAFGYFAKRYNLKYLSAYKGFSPDAEPTPLNLIELSKKLNQNNVEYIYYEELIMPRVAETIARETGARLLMLHAAHNVTSDEMDKGVTFLSIMEQNLRNLKIGLQCQ